MPKYKFIVDISTDRIIYFTEDENESLITDEYSGCATFSGDLPKGFTSKNCYTFKYKDQQIVNNEVFIPANSFTALKSNKLAALENLNTAVKVVIDNASVFFFDSYLLNDAKNFMNQKTDGQWLDVYCNSHKVSRLAASLSIIEQSKVAEDYLLSLYCFLKRQESIIESFKTAQEFTNFKMFLEKQLQSFVYIAPKHNPGWLCSQEYSFNEELEENYEVIYKEALDILRQGLFTQHTQSEKNSIDDKKIANEWLVFDLLRGNKTGLIDKCPVTWSILSKYPEVYNKKDSCIYFSIAPAGAIIKPHRGPLDIVRARHQLCLTAPKETSLDKVYIQVNDEKRAWSPGKVLSFDDSYIHDVKNLSDEDRIVLLYDSELIKF